MIFVHWSCIFDTNISFVKVRMDCPTLSVQIPSFRKARSRYLGRMSLLSMSVLLLCPRQFSTCSQGYYTQAGSNTIAMFSINSKEPARLKMVGQPVSTGGEFPVSVTISKQSGQVCVLNGGRVNGVKFVTELSPTPGFPLLTLIIQTVASGRTPSSGSSR